MISLLVNTVKFHNLLPNYCSANELLNCNNYNLFSVTAEISVANFITPGNGASLGSFYAKLLVSAYRLRVKDPSLSLSQY